VAAASTIIWRVVPDEHVRAVHALQQYHTNQERRLTRELRIAAAVVAGAALLALIAWRWWTTRTAPVALLFAFAVPALAIALYAATRPFSVKHAARSQLRDNPLVTEERRYVFDKGGLTIAGKSFEDKFAWADVTRIAETPEFFLIFALRSAYYLPKRAIAWPETLDGLREIFRDAIGDRSRVR
jgi:hypothetical protein